MNKQEKITQYCLLFEMALFKLSSKISKCFGEKFIVIAIKEDSEEYRKMKKYDIIKFSKIKS